MQGPLRPLAEITSCQHLSAVQLREGLTLMESMVRPLCCPGRDQTYHPELEEGLAVRGVGQEDKGLDVYHWHEGHISRDEHQERS